MSVAANRALLSVLFARAVLPVLELALEALSYALMTLGNGCTSTSPSKKPQQTVLTNQL